MKSTSIFAAAALLVAGCGTPTPDFRQTVAAAKAAVSPAVVYIRVIYNDNDTGRNRKGEASGSGVIISNNGEVLTNHHVIDKTSEIRCQLADGRAFPAKVIGKDKDMDIALLQLELNEKDSGTLPSATLAARVPDVGEIVLAMGAPWGLARSVTMGIVSCNDRFLENCGDYTLWYQTDAAISPGNSGGPLVDTEGNVIGINTRGNADGAQGFTIPASTVIEVLPNLRKYGEAHWAWFGFKLQPLTDFRRNIHFDAEKGVLVANVERNSPAAHAGLQVNDLIVAIDGVEVTAKSWEQIPVIERMLAHSKIETAVTFTVERRDEKIEIEIVPTEKGKVEGEEFVCTRWGLTAKEINRFYNPDLAFFAPDGGVYISGTAWDGNADNCGLREKDIVVSIGGVRILSIADIRRVYEDAVAAVSTRPKLPIIVTRSGRQTSLVLDFSEDTEKDD